MRTKLREIWPEIEWIEDPELKEKVYQKNYVTTSKYLEDENAGISIYTLIETRDYSKRDEFRNRMMAMTLVDFLRRKSSRGLRSFIKDLKSDAAPVPPKTYARRR